MAARPEPAAAAAAQPRSTPGPRDRVRVLICDDHEIYRLGLCALLQQSADLVLVGEADDPGQALLLAYENDPQVVLVGQSLSRNGCLELIRRLSPHQTAVVVLADSPDENDLVDALRAGARGYLTRRTPPQRLLEGIRAVSRQETALDGNVTAWLVRHLDGIRDGPPVAARDALPTPEPDALPLSDLLTARQCTVAALVAEGLSNAEIAGRLYLSQATVKSHLTIILRRLGLRDRTQLAILVNRGATLGGP